MTGPVCLAFLDVSIVTVALAIGLATFTMVTLGVMLGRVLGSRVLGSRQLGPRPGRHCAHGNLRFDTDGAPERA